EIHFPDDIYFQANPIEVIFWDESSGGALCTGLNFLPKRSMFPCWPSPRQLRSLHLEAAVKTLQPPPKTMALTRRCLPRHKRAIPPRSFKLACITSKARACRKTTSKQRCGMARQRSREMPRQNRILARCTTTVKEWHRTARKRLCGISRQRIREMPRHNTGWACFTTKPAECRT